MEHPLELPHPWRTRAIVAAAVAAIELVVLLALAVALVSRPLSRHVERAAAAKALAPPKPARPAPAGAVAKPRLTRGETSVLVLNGNGRAGAAGAEAARVRGLGYMIGGVGNAPRTDYTRTLVMYRRGYRPEALRLARDTGIRIVTPLDGLRASQLMGAHIALVVGSS